MRSLNEISEIRGSIEPRDFTHSLTAIVVLMLHNLESAPSIGFEVKRLHSPTRGIQGSDLIR